MFVLLSMNGSPVSLHIFFVFKDLVAIPADVHPDVIMGLLHMGLVLMPRVELKVALDTFFAVVRAH